MKPKFMLLGFQEVTRMKRYVLLTLALVAFSLCMEHNFSVLYFYHPRCPNCIAVAPYVSYLAERYGVNITRYDVSTSSGARAAAELNVTAVPTLIILEGEREERFVGRLAVTRAEYRIAELVGAPEPERPFNASVELDPMLCLRCHSPTPEQRRLIPPQVLRRLNATLPPPSTYSCSYCCHLSRR